MGCPVTLSLPSLGLTTSSQGCSCLPLGCPAPILYWHQLLSFLPGPRLRCSATLMEPPSLRAVLQLSELPYWHIWRASISWVICELLPVLRHFQQIVDRIQQRNSLKWLRCRLHRGSDITSVHDLVQYKYFPCLTQMASDTWKKLGIICVFIFCVIWKTMYISIIFKPVHCIHVLPVYLSITYGESPLSSTYLRPIQLSCHTVLHQSMICNYF
jgi:hypothetical protein